MKCHQCSSLVCPKDAIGGMVQCPACQAIIEVQSTPAPSDQKTSLPASMAGAQIQETDDLLTVVLPWNQDTNLLVTIARTAGWVLLPFVVLGSSTPMGLIELGIFLCADVVLFYIWLIYRVNSTTFTITSDGIDVSPGPLPPTGSKTLPSRLLHDLQVVPVVHRRKTTVTTYQLEASGVVLTKNWARRENLDIVIQVVKAVNNQSPRPPQ